MVGGGLGVGFGGVHGIKLIEGRTAAAGNWRDSPRGNRPQLPASFFPILHDFPQGVIRTYLQLSAVVIWTFLQSVYRNEVICPFATA